MRILFLTHRVPYAPNRGDRIRAYHLLEAMSKFADVSLFSLAHDAEEASRGAEVPFVTEARVARVRRFRNYARGAWRLPSSRPLTHSLLDAPDAKAILVSMIRRSKPDLIVAYCSGMARFAFEPYLAGIPVVVDFVDMDSVKWHELADASDPLRGWVYRREGRTLERFETDAAARAEVALVVNDRERAVLERLAPETVVEVLENGVDLDAFRPVDAPTSSSTVVFCGVMSYQPNADGVRWFAREVWPTIRARRPDARLVIVGSGPSREISALSRSEPSIEVVGQVPAVQPYLWEAAVSIAPLHVARGLQNKVLEAHAAGVPTVVTPAVFDGLPASARSACVSATTEPEFADAVVAGLNRSPGERRRLALASTEGLDWPGRFARLESVLRAAVRRTGADALRSDNS